MSDPEENERGFTIVDRRGSAGVEEDAEAEAPHSAPVELPEADFSSFLLSLATSALYHLGLVAEPETGE